MPKIQLLFRQVCIVTALGFIASLPAAEADARPNSSKSRIQKKKSKKRKARKAKAKHAKKKTKVTYKKILRWWRAGTSNRKIVARAKRAGYVPSKKDVRRLTKKRVSKKLIVALQGKTQAEKPQYARRPTKIDIKTIYSEDDIDFDSVPPPPGTPSWTKQMSASKKKTLDRSLRPSAPFEGARSDATAGKKKRRTVGAASRNGS